MKNEELKEQKGGEKNGKPKKKKNARKKDKGGVVQKTSKRLCKKDNH